MRYLVFTILTKSHTLGKYSIARARNNISIGKFFEGKIDDIRFYNRVLTLSQINQLNKLSSSCQLTASKDPKGSAPVIIYPNPSHSLFEVSLLNSNQEMNISVYNLLGDELLDSNFQSSIAVLDLSHFQNGIYLIHIQGNGISEKRRIEKF